MSLKVNSKNERGAELLEFALVLPLLLLLVLGAIEFGRAYFTYNILAKAVRDGARYAATTEVSSTGTLDATALTKSKNVVVFGNSTGTGTKKILDLQTSQVTVTQTFVSAFEQYTNVIVAYPYQPLFSLILPATITMRPSVRMQFVGRIVFPTS